MTTEREKLCRQCSRKGRKKVGGIWRCTVKREVYLPSETATVMLHRVPTCEQILNCKYRPEPEGTNDEKESDADPSDNGTPDVEGVCSQEESKISD